LAHTSKAVSLVELSVQVRTLEAADTAETEKKTSIRVVSVIRQRIMAGLLL